MASSGFPARKSQGGGGMTSPGAGQEVLDGPPPSPVMGLAGGGQLPPGAAASQPMPSFEQMAAPMTAGSPGRATSPEIAVGMMQSAETINSMLDSFASIAPDLANDFALLKDLLSRTKAKLLTNSGQPGNPMSTGTNFPGGGFASGSM